MAHPDNGNGIRHGVSNANSPDNGIGTGNAQAPELNFVEGAFYRSPNGYFGIRRQWYYHFKDGKLHNVMADGGPLPAFLANDDANTPNEFDLQDLRAGGYVRFTPDNGNQTASVTGNERSAPNFLVQGEALSPDNYPGGEDQRAFDNAEIAMDEASNLVRPVIGQHYALTNSAGELCLFIDEGSPGPYLLYFHGDHWHAVSPGLQLLATAPFDDSDLDDFQHTVPFDPKSVADWKRVIQMESTGQMRSLVRALDQQENTVGIDIEQHLDWFDNEALGEAAATVALEDLERLMNALPLGADPNPIATDDLDSDYAAARANLHGLDNDPYAGVRVAFSAAAPDMTDKELGPFHLDFLENGIVRWHFYNQGKFMPQSRRYPKDDGEVAVCLRVAVQTLTVQLATGEMQLHDPAGTRISPVSLMRIDWDGRNKRLSLVDANSPMPEGARLLDDILA